MAWEAATSIRTAVGLDKSGPAIVSSRTFIHGCFLFKSCRWTYQNNSRERMLAVSNRADGNSLWSTCLSPACRLRPGHSSSDPRKIHAKKQHRERPAVEGDDNQGEERRESRAKKAMASSGEDTASVADLGHGAGMMGLDLNSGWPTDADGGSQVSSNGLVLMDAETNRAELELKEGNLANEEGVFSGVTVHDLMLMIKEAEKNILLLNQVRARTLEELKHAHSDIDVLQGQVNVLSARLAESEARLKLVDQAKEKNRFLEDELSTLQAQLAEKEENNMEVLKLEAQHKGLQNLRQSLVSRLEVSSNEGAEVALLRSQVEKFQEEIQALQLSPARGKVDEGIVNDLQREKEAAKQYNKSLELKLSQSEQDMIDYARVKVNEVALQQEVNQVRERLDSNQTLGNLPENELLRQQLLSTQGGFNIAEADKAALKAAQAENFTLRQQVKLLEDTLSESAADIRKQLEVYQSEVEAFQASLDGFKVGDETVIAQLSVGDMPWDFWSNILLHIDALMLGKELSLEDGLELRMMAWHREARIRDAYLAVQNKNDTDVAANLIELTKLKKKRPGFHVVHICAEMAPVAKVGGLGDVVTGLGRALQKKGHLVEIILPKYDCMDYSRIKNLKVLDVELNSYFDGQLFKNKIWLGIVEGLPVYFIEPYHPARYFWRGQFYGEGDDFRRFTYFSRAALEFLLQSGKRPDVIHTHDWQTAVVAPLYWDIYVSKGLNSARLAFTCHNFEYQGIDTPAALGSCGLSPQQQHRQDRMQDNFNNNKINLLKGGIVYSNIVTTVSPTYAQEVRAPEGGRGLHLTLAQHAKKFTGVLNGIDDDAWNPATDPLLEFQFSADDLSGKSSNKAALRNRLGLEGARKGVDRPLVACITRLVPQKGVHLIRHAIYRSLESGAQFILLGSSPVPNIQQEFEGIARSFEGHPHIRLVLKYDEALSHAIYAASDMFVIPSIFEPCGLTQMIAMRYGSIPVVRKTGGLNDSVFDADDASIPLGKRNGFTFSAADEGGLNYALDRALAHYNQQPQWWMELVARAMRMDYSWDSSADVYVDLYSQSIERAKVRAA